VRPQYDPSHHLAHVPEDVRQLRAYVLDNVDRITGYPPEPELAPARELAVKHVRGQMDTDLMQGWLPSLRQANTVRDMIAVFEPDSASAGDAPALATGR